MKPLPVYQRSHSLLEDIALKRRMLNIPLAIGLHKIYMHIEELLRNVETYYYSIMSQENGSLGLQWA